MPDREKVIKALEDFDKNRICLPHLIPWDEIADARTILKEQRWIPVSERLPDDGSDILAYCDDGEESRIVACNYDNGVWFDCVFNTLMIIKNITHWMPLPKPPKKEGEQE